MTDRECLSDTHTISGKLIRFSHNVTEELIADFLLDDKTDDESIENAVELIHNKIDKYDKEHDGDCSDFNIISELYNALTESCCTVKVFKPYREFYL